MLAWVRFTLARGALRLPAHIAERSLGCQPHAAPHCLLGAREAANGRSVGAHRHRTSRASCRSLLHVLASVSQPTHAMRTSARVWAGTRAQPWPSSREDAANFATAHRHRGPLLPQREHVAVHWSRLPRCVPYMHTLERALVGAPRCK
ncbi:hypothetical protein T492DRAFT_25731 [Pavlovales sp. CCMP2436]|nr:hypothetical protein T492DRAFT_25731 [Pavlovales sp. CCMP2436]